MPTYVGLNWSQVNVFTVTHSMSVVVEKAVGLLVNKTKIKNM